MSKFYRQLGIWTEGTPQPNGCLLWRLQDVQTCGHVPYISTYQDGIMDVLSGLLMVEGTRVWDKSHTPCTQRVFLDPPWANESFQSRRTEKQQRLLTPNIRQSQSKIWAADVRKEAAVTHLTLRKMLQDRASLTTYPLIWHHSNSCLSHTRHETLSNKVLITSSFKHPYIISVLSLLPCCHLLCRYHEFNLKNPAAPMTYYLSFRPIINSKNSFLWSFRLCLPLLIQKWWSVTLNCQPW